MSALDKMVSEAKLSWCKENIPKTLDAPENNSLTNIMDKSYKFVNSRINIEIDSTVNEINNFMDEMVLKLTRVFGDKLAFKGGYMLTKLMPSYARQTTDIDFSISDSSLYKDLIEQMNNIGEEFIKKGYINSYKVKDTIKDHMSGGMDMYDSTGKKVLGIDIGWHDLTFGTTVTSIDIGDINAFSIERMMADKITAILSRKRFRRPKDLYDLYCITNCFNFNTDCINEFILKRTGGSGAEWNNYPFSEEILIEYRKAYDKLSLNSMYKGVVLQKPKFEDVINRFNILCECLISSKTCTWNHEKEIFI